MPGIPFYISMKARLLLFCCGMRAEREIYRSLLDSDFTVRRVFGISNLHRTLVSQSVDAIVVSQEFMALRRISPSSHLTTAKSPVLIVAWSYLPDGSLFAEAFSALDIPPDSGEYPERVLLQERIRRAIEGGPCSPPGEVLDPEAIYAHGGQNAAHGSPIQDLVLHRKMRIILNAIALTGDGGIMPDALVREAWGPGGKNRRKDLHSYISKLRKVLAGTDEGRYRIVFRDRRYRLLDTNPAIPGGTEGTLPRGALKSDSE